MKLPMDEGDERSVVMLGNRQLWRHADRGGGGLYWPGIEKNISMHKG
jgi:hypothetical protein